MCKSTQLRHFCEIDLFLRLQACDVFQLQTAENGFVTDYPLMVTTFTLLITL